MRELWQTSIRVRVRNPAMRILDVGCGSGIWAREVAEALPRSRVVGVDLSPTYIYEEPNRRIPENLFFEVNSMVGDALKCRSMISTSVFSIQMPTSIW
jgi:ubiquinone/menaquinone biosynthesis C-methylase UbiE